MSINQDPRDAIDQVTRTTQIIVGALISGVTIFLLIVGFMVHFGVLGAVAGAPGQAAAPNVPGAAAPGNNPAAGPGLGLSMPLLTYIAVGMAAIMLPLSFILPGIVANQSLRAAAASGTAGGPSPTTASAKAPGAVGGPAAAFQTSAIVGGALNEGAAFFAGIAYLIEQNVIALVVAVILLAVMVVRFPTRERVDRWIAQQEEKLRWGSSG
jgi:hypothetical protein